MFCWLVPLLTKIDMNGLVVALYYAFKGSVLEEDKGPQGQAQGLRV
jgi:hypothetical protein